MEIIKQNEFTLEAWKEVKIKVIHKKGDVENVGNFIASFVQTVLDKTVQKIVSTTRPRTSGRPGRVQKLIPDNRPPCDEQND